MSTLWASLDNCVGAFVDVEQRKGRFNICISIAWQLCQRRFASVSMLMQMLSVNANVERHFTSVSVLMQMSSGSFVSLYLRWHRWNY